MTIYSHNKLLKDTGFFCSFDRLAVSGKAAAAVAAIGNRKSKSKRVVELCDKEKLVSNYRVNDLSVCFHELTN